MAPTWLALAELRRRIFIDRQGWPLSKKVGQRGESVSAFKPALVVEAKCSGIGAFESLTVKGLREALVQKLTHGTKQDEVSEAIVSERTTNNKALERIIPNAKKGP